MNSVNQSYEKLKQLLLNNPQWPRLYMFKFVVPNKNGNVERVVSLLPPKEKYHTNTQRT